MAALSMKEAIAKGKLVFKPWLKSFSPERFEVSFSDIIKNRGDALYISGKSERRTSRRRSSMQAIKPFKSVIAPSYGNISPRNPLRCT